LHQRAPPNRPRRRRLHLHSPEIPPPGTPHARGAAGKRIVNGDISVPVEKIEPPLYAARGASKTAAFPPQAGASSSAHALALLCTTVHTHTHTHTHTCTHTHTHTHTQIKRKHARTRPRTCASPSQKAPTAERLRPQLQYPRSRLPPREAMLVGPFPIPRGGAATTQSSRLGSERPRVARLPERRERIPVLGPLHPSPVRHPPHPRAAGLPRPARA
jgi:hypothetical protein